MKTLSHEEAVLRAQTLAVHARRVALETEATRRLPESTLASMRELGLHRLMTPKRFGGSELGWRTFFDTTLAISKACAATGWCVGFQNYHCHMVGFLDERAQRDVWAEQPDAMVATCFAPFGTVQSAPGGYRLSGQWAWCSGVDHSDWILLGAIAPPGAAAERPHLRLFLVPRHDFTILDTWHVSGLRGSGSNDVRVDDAFVPAHRTLAGDDLREGTGPGAVASDLSIYGLPQVAAAPLSLATPAVGAALGAMEETLAILRERALAPRPFDDGMVQRMRLAEACDAAEWAQRLLADIAVRSEDPAPFTLAERARHRYHYAHAVRLALRATDTFLELAGARSNYDDSPVQRAFRDVHAIAGHTLLSMNRAGELYGRSLTGLGPHPKDGLF